MKAKRIDAFFLIALLQIGACLALVGNNSVQTNRIRRGGTSYRFAIQSVTSYRSNNQTFVNIFYPPALPLPEEEYSADTTVYVIDVGQDGLARQKAKLQQGHLRPHRNLRRNKTRSRHHSGPRRAEIWKRPCKPSSNYGTKNQF